MSAWFRWRYLVPRLIICFAAALSAQYTITLLLRNRVERDLASVIGGPVEVGSLHVSPFTGHIVVGELTASKPQSGKNYRLTASGCELQFAVAPLLQKQAVVELATLSGVRIGIAPRPEVVDGGANGFAQEIRRGSLCQEDPARQAGPTLGAKLAAIQLADLPHQFEQDFVSELASVKRAAAVVTRFPDELARIESLSTEFEHNTAELETLVNTALTNFLRHQPTLATVPKRIESLRAELANLKTEIDRLPEILEKERRAVVAARRQDESYLQEKLRLAPLDHDSLSAYLLSDSIAQPLNELMAGLQSVRTMVATSYAPEARNQRGQDILFTGLRSNPNLVIRLLEFNGVAEVAKRDYVVQGQLRNVTSEPTVYREPMLLTLKSTGPTTIELQATIDRTQGQIRDEFLVECRDFPLPKMTLGHNDQLQVSVTPSIGSFSIHLKTVGDHISGNARLTQSQLKFSPKAFGDLSTLDFENTLAATCLSVKTIESHATLSGTIHDPHYTISSNLGRAMSEAIARSLESHAAAVSQTALAAARQRVDEQLTSLERRVAQQQARFADLAAKMPARIESIAQQQRRQGIHGSPQRIGRRIQEATMSR